MLDTATYTYGEKVLENGWGDLLTAYDAWGNHLSTTGTMSATLGTLNPLRYRGYIYDQETDLYYLQSRYYNPRTGRFLNADALTSTGQGELGNNMFAYCLNNPIMLVDSSGMAPFPTTVAIDDSRGKYLKDVTDKERMLYWMQGLRNSVGNTDPSIILKSTGIYCYKGAIVIHTDLAAFGGDRAAFSYGGVICIDDYYTDNELGLATLNHEYGHYIHMKQVGLPVYTVTAAMPSLAGAIIADPNGSAFQKFLNKYYHSQP